MHRGAGPQTQQHSYTAAATAQSTQTIPFLLGFCEVMDQVIRVQKCEFLVGKNG